MGEQYFCIRAAGTKIRPAGLFASIFRYKTVKADLKNCNGNFVSVFTQNGYYPLRAQGLTAAYNPGARFFASQKIAGA
jgi:hypothetical protein